MTRATPNQPTLRPREMELAIATWLGWTEIQADDGGWWGRNPAGQLREIPLYCTSRFAIQSALQFVEVLELTPLYRAYLKRVVWACPGRRDADSARDSEKAEALVLMIREMGGANATR